MRPTYLVFKKKKRGKRARVTSTKTTESQVRVMSPRTRSIARRHRRKMVVDQFSLSKLQRLSEVLRRKESSVYLRHIGTGKFANVYKVSNALELCRLISAEDDQENEDSASTTSALQKIAIRILRADTDSDFARQELRSALLVCNRVVEPHPNLIRERIFSNGISIQPLYDDDLENIVYRSGKPLDRKDLSLVMQRIANALHYLHEHGIGHFDVKPENILVRWPDIGAAGRLNGATIALADMGLAARLGPKGEYRGMWRGTSDYMAPELAKLKSRGKLCHGTACDVFSLGVSMLWLATCSFSRRDLCKKCGPVLGKLISKMLVRAPEDRITMLELLSKLS